MELKQAYISQAVCHRFSLDPTKSLLNSKEIDLDKIDADILKKFFVMPFSKIKREYGFAHPVDIRFNVLYQTSISILDGADFIDASKSIFKQLSSVSSNPSIKDGDVFICKIEDIECEGCFLEGICIFKIENKNDFIETHVDRDGHLNMSMKTGFSTNKIDKAALIIFSVNQPTVLIIDKSKETKFWKDEFLGLVAKQNSHSQTEDAVRLLKEFVTTDLFMKEIISKDRQIQFLNKGIELMKSKPSINLKEIGDTIFEETSLCEQFDAYRKAFEERENIKFQDSFAIDKSGLATPKSVRRIRLDDNAEIHLLKTGKFIERGFDVASNMYFYKLYFSKEK